MQRRHFLRLALIGAGGAWRPGLLAARGAGLSQDDSRVQALSQLIEAKMAEYRIPGVGFGLSKNGETVLRGFGLTNIDNPQPVTLDTVFPIASISKTVVTTAVMRLVEEGRLDLEAPVREYIADFAVQDASASREVRIWHLLIHRVGRASSTRLIAGTGRSRTSRAVCATCRSSRHRGWYGATTTPASESRDGSSRL